MVKKAWSVARVLACSVAALAFVAGEAQARENDLVLTRFATFDYNQYGTDSNPCELACGQVQPDDDSFSKLTSDLGEVFAPRFSNPAETLGEAGFAVNFLTSVSFIQAQEPHWQEGVEDRDPSSTLLTGHLQLRKGLPFSFEVAGDMSYLFDSEMFAMGAHVKWALNEGFYYMPDVAVRGSVNTLLGADTLNLVTAGWDVSISKDFGLGGVVSLAPFLGYQNLYIISSSRLLNAYPQDPRPPQSDPNDATRIFSPEFVFSQRTQTVNRFFMGARLNVWILSFVAEGMIGQNVNQLNFSAGVDF